MNERIRELAHQARQIGEYGNYGQIELSHTQFEQKFAELIVNQCADIAQQHNKSPVAAPLAIGYVIREHFGVEE
jgi:hypothetical protein